MKRHLLALILIFLIAPIAHAEYYLVYGPSYNTHCYPTKHRKHHVRHHKHQYRKHAVYVHANVIRRERCGCSPDTCDVPYRPVYTTRPTDCVTYDDVVRGYEGY